MANGSLVGSIPATDVDAGTVLTYSITAGNDNGSFAIDATTGAITVLDSTILNYEETPYYSLTVTASDGPLTNAGTLRAYPKTLAALRVM